jgi:hypothetical protein
MVANASFIAAFSSGNGRIILVRALLDEGTLG